MSQNNPIAPNVKDIGNIIRWHRKLAGLSRVDLARLAGVGKTSIFDLEHGKQTVQLRTLLRILDVLNIRLVPTGPLMSNYPARHDADRNPD